MSLTALWRGKSPPSKTFRSSAALLDEYFDTVEDAFQAELEGVPGVGDSVVVLAGRRADPCGHGVTLGVKHLSEPGSSGGPPRRAIHAAAALDVEGVDRMTSGTGDG